MGQYCFARCHLSASSVSVIVCTAAGGLAGQLPDIIIIIIKNVLI